MNLGLKTSVRAALVIASLLASGSVFAQATRTWVSGVGDDANPCSRTAPCKTFAGAISKTAAGGEISVLDPGGYGAVTITKAITINGTGTLGSTLAGGTNGVVVNVGASDVVTLRNIDLIGVSGATNGIRFIGAGTLIVENVNISGFVNRGIEFIPSASSRLYVSDSTISRTTGIRIAPTAGSVQASLDRVRLLNNNTGLRAEANTNVSLRDCTVSGSAASGVVAASDGALAQVSVDNCQFSGNAGLAGNSAIKASGAGGVAIISNNAVSNNSIGLSVTGGGSIVSFGNNNVTGNGTDGDPTSTISTR